jgi:diguanylate cyclase (GGDEF)-like protein/PAS domain S-box-containing protein
VLADRFWPWAATQGWLGLGSGLALVALGAPLLYGLLRHVVLAHERSDEARHVAEGILATMSEPLLVLDPALRVVQANDAFYRSFRTTPQQTEGRFLYELGNRQWDIPRLRELLETILPQNTAFNGFEVEHDFPQIGRRTMLLNARRLYRDAQKTERILLGITDVSELKRSEAELRAAIERMNLLLSATPVVIYAARPSGDYGATYVSPNVFAQTGYTPEEFTRDSAFWAEHIHPEDRPRVFAELSRLCRDDRHVHEYRFRHRDGSWRWMYDERRLVRDGRGQPKEILGYWVDITARRRAEEQARESAARLERYVAQSQIVLYVLEPDAEGWAPVWVSGNVERITGYTVEEALARDWWARHLHPEDRERALARSGRLLREGGTLRHEYRFLHKDGSVLWVEDHLECTLHPDGRPARIIGSWIDVTERRQYVETIERLAFYDPLTELPNRALFHDRLEQALAAARRHRQPLAVLFLDFDRFKDINDAYGHTAGDAVLVEAGRRLRASLRGEETLARFPGDEFCVFSPGAGQEAAAVIAERLCEALARPFAVNGKEVICPASIGLALYPGDGQTPSELLRAADVALSRAKQARAGGYHFYDRDTAAAVRRRADLSARLRRALERGELQLYYQPQVDLAAGRLAGAEALLRWHDPEHGWVNPAEFIPLAEQMRFIVELGEWTFAQACLQLRAWEAAGLWVPGRIAINVSGFQFNQTGFAERVRSLVESAGIGAARIELEITETSLIADLEKAAGTIRALQAAGFSFALDDFGTGYSSLRYLRYFRFDKLKIDGSFVQGMLAESSDRVIVTTIIAIAKSLGTKCLAEGVEEAAQAQELRALGCDLAQGFHFGRPQPAEVFAGKWLQAGRGG